MPTTTSPSFETCTLADLRIQDEASFRHVGLCGDLKRALERANYTFRILEGDLRGRWDHALLLNLTYWGATGGGDVLVSKKIEADVVAHVAWHHLAAAALSDGAPLCPEALFLGEAIASAFDVYLVGRLVGHAPDSSFLESQVPAMADAAEASGLPEAEFDALLQELAADPERAFEDLRSLLFDTSMALFACETAEEGLNVLARASGHRFAPILHRYELSNWVLYARAYGRPSPASRERALELDRSLKAAPVALDVLEKTWVAPALKS